MKYLISSLLILTSYNLIGQCRYEVNEIDEFTKTKHLITEHHKIRGKGLKREFVYFGQKTDSVRLLGFHVYTNGVERVSAGSKIIFLFDNQDTFTVINEVEGMSKRSQYSGVWVNLLMVVLDDETESALRNNSVHKIRFYFDEGYKEQEVNKGGKDKIKSVFDCI